MSILRKNADGVDIIEPDFRIGDRCRDVERGYQLTIFDVTPTVIAFRIDGDPVLAWGLRSMGVSRNWELITQRPATSRECSVCSKNCDLGKPCWWCGAAA